MKRKVFVLFSYLLVFALLLTGVDVLPAKAADVWTVNPAGPNPCTDAVGLRQCTTIQAAINASKAGDVINVVAATYTETLVINHSLTISGAGIGQSIIIPDESHPNECGDSHFCSPPGSPPNATIMILVESSDVTIHGFTLDGNNPNIGGNDINARIGITTNHNNIGQIYNNLTIYHVEVKNMYLTGIMISTRGTFNIHHNSIKNVQGVTWADGMLNYLSSGTFSSNTLSDVNYGIRSWESLGASIINNYIFNAVYGIASVYNQSTSELIGWNTVTNSAQCVVIDEPGKATRVEGNTINNCFYGIFAHGKTGTGDTTTLFINNTISGANAGAYVTTDFGGISTDVAVQFLGNTITGNKEGIFLEEISPKKLTNSAINFNNISGNNISGNPTNGLKLITYESAAHIINAETNWWGSAAGPQYPNNGISTNIPGTIDVDPIALALVSSQTGSIHNLGEPATLETHVVAGDLYSADLLVKYNSSVLNFNLTGSAANDQSLLGWYWDLPFEYLFDTSIPNQTRLAGGMTDPPHSNPATLTGQLIATWSYICEHPGNSSLIYDFTNTLLRKKDETVIPAALTGGSVLCIDQNDPTAIFVSEFSATPAIQSINVQWSTGNELELLGFNLYRSTSIYGYREPMNKTMIEAMAPGGVFPGAYSFIDYDVLPGRTYYYWLESVETTGSFFVEEPAQGTAGYSMYLPNVLRNQ